jgi:tetratricopeptide (TPR) repeat protein
MDPARVAYTHFGVVDSKTGRLSHPVSFLNEAWLSETEVARPVRVLSEFIEPEARLAACNVKNTILFFGSARSKSREDFAAALEYYSKSQVENYTSATDKKIKEIQAMKKQKEDLAYLDDAKALEEKEAGTALFKEGKFPDAIKRYTESLKRNPKDHTVYSNRAQCYLKLMTPQPAVKDAEKCIELKADFARGWSRRGMAYKMLKEYTLAMDDFNMALSLDKDYRQDQALDWGHLTRPEIAHGPSRAAARVVGATDPAVAGELPRREPPTLEETA